MKAATLAADIDGDVPAAAAKPKKAQKQLTLKQLTFNGTGTSKSPIKLEDSSDDAAPSRRVLLPSPIPSHGVLIPSHWVLLPSPVPSYQRERSPFLILDQMELLLGKRHLLQLQHSK